MKFKTVILLVNTDRNASSPAIRVQGISGKTYGSSRFISKYKCHVARIPAETYTDRMEKDLRGIAHLPYCNWTARMIVELETPEGIVDIPAHEFIAQQAREIDALKIGATEAGKKLTVITPKSESELAQAFKLPKFMSLKKMAKDRGIDISAVKGSQAVYDLITAHDVKLAAV